METTTNQQSRINQAIFLLLILVTFASCGTYQSVYRSGDDGIYSYEEKTYAVVDEAKRSRKKNFDQEYFAKKLQEIEQLSEDDIITDIDAYYYDDATAEADSVNTYNAPWEQTGDLTIVIDYGYRPYRYYSHYWRNTFYQPYYHYFPYYYNHWSSPYYSPFYGPYYGYGYYGDYYPYYYGGHFRPHYNYYRPYRSHRTYDRYGKRNSYNTVSRRGTSAKNSYGSRNVAAVVGKDYLNVSNTTRSRITSSEAVVKRLVTNGKNKGSKRSTAQRRNQTTKRSYYKAPSKRNYQKSTNSYKSNSSSRTYSQPSYRSSSPSRSSGSLSSGSRSSSRSSSSGSRQRN
ncbi:MAG: hypothetical protein QGH06_00100 [Lutibacter sp.]|nr:hypothetical protein [Lutibacter sp.]